MSVKKTIANVGIGLIILLIGFGLGIYFERGISPSSPSIGNPDDLVKPEIEKIDSLKEEIGRREEIISHLKDSVRVIETIRTVEVDNIRKLPIDSGVGFLKQKLREYEDMF